MESPSAPVQILHGKEYCRQARPASSRLDRQAIERCQGAIRQWRTNPRHPGLNFEFLGKGEKQNHWSIRASRERRVILAVRSRNSVPSLAAVVNIGHHDPMYERSARRGLLTDVSDRSTVLQPEHPAMQRAVSGDAAAPPMDCE